MSTITDYLYEDHERLNLQLQDFLELLASDFDQAKQSFIDYKSALEQHLYWEEQILFPYFKAYLSLIHGPIHVMKGEHNQIKQKLADITQQLSEYSGEKEFDEDLHILHLERLLLDHCLKEEQILYPKLDSMLTDEEAQKIINSRNLPEHATIGLN